MLLGQVYPWGWFGLAGGLCHFSRYQEASLILTDAPATFNSSRGPPAGPAPGFLSERGCRTPSPLASHTPGDPGLLPDFASALPGGLQVSQVSLQRLGRASRSRLTFLKRAGMTVTRDPA